MAGRKTKLTPEVREIFVKDIKAGIPAEHVCPKAGIHSGTYYAWMADGRKAKSGAKKEFCEAIEGAKSTYLSNLVGMLSTHIYDTYQQKDGKFDPYLVLKILNMRDRDNWGENKKHEVLGGITVVRTATPRPPQIEQTEESDGT